MERAIHVELKDDRIINEWFEGPRVNAFIPWFRRCSKRAVDHYWATGEMPPPPDVSEIPRQHLRAA